MSTWSQYGLQVIGSVQGALSSSSTLDQLQAFAKMAHLEHVDDQDLAWQVLYLALRAGHIDAALKVGPQQQQLLLLQQQLLFSKSCDIDTSNALLAIHICIPELAERTARQSSNTSINTKRIAIAQSDRITLVCKKLLLPCLLVNASVWPAGLLASL